MHRTLDDALLALRQQLRLWASHKARPDIRVLVYAPEDEARLLARLPDFAQECSANALPIELVDLAHRFHDALASRPHRLASLLRDDAAGKSTLPRDLEAIATTLLESLLSAELAPPAICRILANTGALATFISYSAIANRLYDAVSAPAVLLFPGEGDDRALNILRLRADPAYRVPRI